MDAEAASTRAAGGTSNVNKLEAKLQLLAAEYKFKPPILLEQIPYIKMFYAIFYLERSNIIILE